MKSTEIFKNTISQYLEGRAVEDPLFAETLKKPNKTIDDCINYIFSEVQKIGCNGFADEEIFGMAVHYYDEDNVIGEKPANLKVVVNHVVELSPEETENARQAAFDKVVAEEKERIRKKSPKHEQKVVAQQSLF